MSIALRTINTDLYRYTVDMSLKESSLLQSLRKETLALPEGNMISSPEQAQFIGLLIRMMQAKHVLEIGTFTGYTALVMAQSIPDDGHVLTCDRQNSATSIAQKYWKAAAVDHKIRYKVQPGLTVLDDLLATGQANHYDLAYIDADKNNTIHYYEKLLTLLRPGGVIVIDNILWQGKVLQADPEDQQTLAIQTLNQTLYNDPRVSISTLLMGDGITLAYKMDPTDVSQNKT